MAQNKKFELQAEGSFLLVRPNMPVVNKEAVVPVLVEQVGTAVPDAGMDTPLVMNGEVYSLGRAIKPSTRESLRPGALVYFKTDSVDGWFFDQDLPGTDKRLAVLHEDAVLVSRVEKVSMLPDGLRGANGPGFVARGQY